MSEPREPLARDHGTLAVVEREAVAKMAADPKLTINQARAEIWKSRHELRAAYQQERRPGILQDD